MRRIMASLVVGNILVFAWFQWVAGLQHNNNGRLPVASNTLETGQGIVLLEEAEQRVKPDIIKPVADSSPRSDDAGISTPAPETSVCTMVGPFEELLQAEYFSERLLALNLVAEVRQITVTGKAGYWLYLPPEASRKEALRRLGELQRRGIDSYVIPSGERANGISLGMFSKQEGVRALRNKVTKMGYSPVIMVVTPERKENWVVLPPGEAARLGAARWAELLSFGESLQKRQNFCADLASS